MSIPTALLGRILVLVAHPDDETAGCGLLLQRASSPMVVFATDGAPRDRYFWGPHGSRLRYARVRQEEAQASLALAGISEVVFLAESAGARELFVDQELYRAIPEAVTRLSALVSRYRPEALVTMAYEGGHPDHDVCSFLGAVLGRRHGLPVWEFALYHRPEVPDTIVWQRFVVATGEPRLELRAMGGEAEIKRQMLAAYPSQGPFLQELDCSSECFRPQHGYDYSRPPHAGRLNYEAWQWPITGGQVCAALVEYLEDEKKLAG